MWILFSGRLWPLNRRFQVTRISFDFNRCRFICDLFFILFFLAGYLTSRLPKLQLPLDEMTSIGKFLRQTKRSCPQRNQILGEEFCRFAIRLKVYTTATNDQRNDTNRLHEMCKDAAANLDLIDPQPNESNHIKLPSTGQFLTESISKALGKWKQNAHQEIRVGNAPGKCTFLK